MVRLLIVLAVIGAIVWYFLSSQDDAPPPRSTPAASQAPEATSRKPVNLDAIRGVAAQHPITLELKENSAGALAIVTWNGDVATIGGDFIQALTEQRLIRDFDLAPAEGGIPAQGMANDAQGRRYWYAHYQLKF